jgi:hypothetical protein
MRRATAVQHQSATHGIGRVIQTLQQFRVQSATWVMPQAGPHCLQQLLGHIAGCATHVYVPATGAWGRQLAAGMPSAVKGAATSKSTPPGPAPVLIHLLTQ